MSRHRRRPVLGILAGLIAASMPGPLPGFGQDPPGIPSDSDSRRELQFLQGLRERNYHDLANDYLDRLREAPEASDDLKEILEFEEGRGLLDEAARSPDLQRRDQLLDLARARLESFLKQKPDHPLASETRLKLAGLHLQRGQTEALKADEATADAERQARLEAARSAFARARTAFEEAAKVLQDEFDAFPVGFIPEDDPQHDARDLAQIRVLEAKLKRGLADYEEAQTYPPESPQRNELLDRAIEGFKDLHATYRTWWAGIAARMWQAKSLEEQGNIGAAMGIYKELLEHAEPELRPLQRQVAFFKIIAHRKREEYPLAAELADEWLRASRGDTGSYERLGVQLELARALDVQLKEGRAGSPAQEKAVSERIVSLLSEVVRYASPYKADAVELLKEYRPTTIIDPRELIGLTFERVVERAREAVASREWPNAIGLLRAALTKVDPARRAEDANEARMLLAYSFYNDRAYYEAAALADFLARRYPDWESAPQAAELGLSSMAMAYDTMPKDAGAATDLDRLADLARYAIQTWPEKDQADVARILLGDIALGRGAFDEAAEAFESVRSDSRRLDARGKAASAYWRKSLTSRRNAPEGTIPPEAEQAAGKARSLLEETLEARKETLALSTDPALLSNVGDLAEIHVAESRPEEAVKILKPHLDDLAKVDRGATLNPIYSRLLKLQLQAHIASGQAEQAIADMKALEEANTGESLTQLFFGLGRLLEQEMDAQRDRGDRAALDRTRKAYEGFLDALSESETGQSFESLQWAGEALLTLDQPSKAREVFERLLKQYPDNPRILRTKLKQVSALRQAKQFNDAWAKIDVLIKANPRSLDLLIERCRLMEDWAHEQPGYWSHAIRYWSELAQQLGNARPRPSEYYEAWYHVAYCQSMSGQKDTARRTLKSVMALSDSLGTPEIKSQYQNLLGRLGG
ncbi:hypothetical protein BH23PLA1_BH23PLA1_27930 [soil metagenome]